MLPVNCYYLAYSLSTTVDSASTLFSLEYIRSINDIENSLFINIANFITNILIHT